jgi:VIT1/CCC1 family predicted Fe2+/Mn2+ transporter
MRGVAWSLVVVGAFVLVFGTATMVLANGSIAIPVITGAALMGFGTLLLAIRPPERDGEGKRK